MMPTIDISTAHDTHKISVGPINEDGKVIKITILKNNPTGDDEVLAWVTLTRDRAKLFQRFLSQTLDQQNVNDELLHSQTRDHLSRAREPWHRKVIDALRRIVAH